MLRTCLDLALLCHPLLAFLSVSRPKSKSPTMAIQNSRLQYFLVSFLSILALRYASTSYFSASAAELGAGTCQTLDQPNPIAAQYPNNATGVLNGTIAVLPIPLDLARSLIPSQYRILEHAYRALLPDFTSTVTKTCSNHSDCQNRRSSRHPAHFPPRCQQVSSGSTIR